LLQLIENVRASGEVARLQNKLFRERFERGKGCVNQIIMFRGLVVNLILIVVVELHCYSEQFIEMLERRDRLCDCRMNCCVRALSE
jgi:hypothetical protein